MNDELTNREHLANDLADYRRGCECGNCRAEAEKFLVVHVDPMTEEGLAAAWEEGRQSATDDRSRSLSRAGQELAPTPNPHREPFEHGQTA